jgi:hypothetical protein
MPEKLTIAEEIDLLKKDMEAMKERLRKMDCYRLGIDPYAPHRAHDVSKRRFK